jgi:glycosyltransferase involved in cell wall biosynthesis
MTQKQEVSLKTVPIDSSLDKSKHIALFLGSLRGGGAERVFLYLAQAFIKRGLHVDMVVSKLKGSLVSDISDSVRIVELGRSNPTKLFPALPRLPPDTWSSFPSIIIRKKPRVVKSLLKLQRYLQEKRPDVLMSTTYFANLVALWAAWLARVDTRVVIRQSNTMSTWVKCSSVPLDRKLPLLVRKWYHRADEIIAVSHGVSDELTQVAAIPRQRISVIYNPIDLERVARSAAQELDDPWFSPSQPPVLVAAGSLHPQKDYPTMLRAFAQVRAERDIRLVILGEGRERPSLETLIGELGVANDVRLLGFQKNPYSYMARAAAFVMSSAWEGLPNVLIEALACGCPIVSTDCPSGPSELLDQGRYGRLVPVGNPVALAEGILATLDAPRDVDRLRKRAAMFSLETVAEEYLQVLLGTKRSKARN